VLGTRAGTRIGGDVVAESLVALGAEVVFGLPGVHALPIWEGLHSTPLRVLGFRQELNAAFAADGHARVTGRPAPLVVSTGPGALMTLGALQEASTAFVPVVVISSQIEAGAIGKGRGHLHELPDQAASFAPLVKWSGRATSTGEIPEVLAEAWRRAAAPPQGPTYVEVPFDVLQAPAAAPPRASLDGSPGSAAVPAADELDRAAALLATATRPAIVAGGGLVRSGGLGELLALAERLDAPVATTYTGKGAIPERHPLALGSGWDDRAHLELLADADVVLCVGSWLGYDVTDGFRLRLAGTLIQVDAAPERIGINLPAIGLAGDARATLAALFERIPAATGRGGTGRVAAVRARVERGLAAQPRSLELGLLRTIEGMLPRCAAAWDSTILAYAACWHLRAPEPRAFLYPAGSSTLGYGFPAALGAAAAPAGTPALAVAGDGGFQYGIAELATARQHGLEVAVLLVDDGGYGILRGYQEGAGYAQTGVDLQHPDFAALCAAYGVPVRITSPDALGDDLDWALGCAGPAVMVLREELTMPLPTP
jgi:acetolactate synthase-1/2/3 large subunit